MVVDGHVGKVFCRTGAVKTVVYESKSPFIIMAKDMRSSIEVLVKKRRKSFPCSLMKVHLPSQCTGVMKRNRTVPNAQYEQRA